MGAVTAAGRLVFEAELPLGRGPQLFVLDPNGSVRSLTAAGSYATFAAALQ